MALVSTIILFITAVIFVFGQLLRLNIADISFPLIDIAIFSLFIFNIIDHIKRRDFKINNSFFLLFLVFSWLTFLLNYFSFQINSPTPLFYLVRLNLLFSFFILEPHFIYSNKKFKSFFTIALTSNVLFGLLQYTFWPDFTYFDAMEWDPHLYRLISTYFDPTFTGFIYLAFLVYIFLNKNFPYRKFLMVFTYLALVLTYSRSTYLSFLLAFSFIAFNLKNLKIFLLSFLLITSTIFLLPRQPGEGTKLERTSSIQAKIENYKEAFKVFSQSPLVGHGYNNLYFVRNIKNTSSHANYGFESSLMTIATTTGTIGLILFLLGLVQYFKKSNLFHKTLLVSLLFHSLFANSLLYPWILLLFFLL